MPQKKLNKVTKKNPSLGTALITGGAKRIGAAIAIALARDGYDIIIHCNSSQNSAKVLQKQIKAIGVNCQIIVADLLNKSEVASLVKELKKINNWRVLINNASIFYQSKFLTSGIDELEKYFTIHVKIPAILSKELALTCQKNNYAGNIINMIDKNIVRYQTKYFHYILSKKSLAELTKMLALELAPQIRVNGIAPGFILNSVDEKNPDAETVQLLAKIPLHKKADEGDITNGVKYLLNSDFITGHILFIDGGASLNHAG